MRVGVIGGCGFLGSHVVDVLVSGGHEVTVVDDASSCWLDPEGEPRFLNPGATRVEFVDAPEFASAEVVLDASLRHPVGRELVLYRECLDRLRLGAEICIDGGLSRSLSRFVVASSLDVDAETPGMLGRHLRAYREALGYLHRPPHLDVEFVHLPELYGPRQLPEAGDVAAAINGAALSDEPAYGHLAYVLDAARLLASRALSGTHRRGVNFTATAPVVDEETLYKVMKLEGGEGAAARALGVKRPRRAVWDADVVLGDTALAEGVRATLDFYRWIGEEEDAGR